MGLGPYSLEIWQGRFVSDNLNQVLSKMMPNVVRIRRWCLVLVDATNPAHARIDFQGLDRQGRDILMSMTPYRASATGRPRPLRLAQTV